MDKNKGIYKLLLDYYDEKRVVSGFRIKEYTNDGQLLIEEDYEIYPGGRKGGNYFSDIIISFQPRMSNQKKDDGSWNNYIAQGKWDRETCPDILISIPSESFLTDR